MDLASLFIFQDDMDTYVCANKDMSQGFCVVPISQNNHNVHLDTKHSWGLLFFQRDAILTS